MKPWRTISLFSLLLLGSDAFAITCEAKTAVPGFFGVSVSRARYYNPQVGRFWTMDTYEGNQHDPLSLHKYLYCHSDPVNGIDPSGHESLFTETLSIFKFTRRFGDEAHRQIQDAYQAENPGAIVGSTTGILGPLKPDIFNGIKKTYGEIKPLSLSGIADAIIQISAYDAYFGLGMGYTPETWPIGVRAAHVGTIPIAYWNLGNGVILYTDEVSNEEDLLKISSWALAREFIRRGLVQRTFAAVAARIPGMVTTRSQADSARLQQHLGIATLVATMGAL